MVSKALVGLHLPQESNSNVDFTSLHHGQLIAPDDLYQFHLDHWKGLCIRGQSRGEHTFHDLRRRANLERSSLSAVEDARLLRNVSHLAQHPSAIFNQLVAFSG